MCVKFLFNSVEVCACYFKMFRGPIHCGHSVYSNNAGNKLDTNLHHGQLPWIRSAAWTTMIYSNNPGNKLDRQTYIMDNSRGSMGQPGPPGGIIIICCTGILNRCGPTKYWGGGPPGSGGPAGSWGIGGGTDGSCCCWASGAAAAAVDGLAAAGGLLPDASSVTVVTPAAHLLAHLGTQSGYQQHTHVFHTYVDADDEMMMLRFSHFYSHKQSWAC